MKVASRELQTLFDVGTLGGLSDGRLLERFTAHREGAAFEALVRRHGPMVWGVCHRLLRDHHDAEDAFQATFLVLAGKGHTIAHRELLANWLYGVAYQTARKARSTRARRRMREVQVMDMPEPEAVCREYREDLTEWLDRELSRLPEKYRIPIVLCELEGKTHREAAEQLGWPIGTVSGRLSRARELLARRLSRRRGVPLSAGSLAVLLARESASASVPTRLIGSTAQAASLSLSGQVATTAAVSALTQGVLKAMLLGKVKKLTMVLSALGLMGIGAIGASVVMAYGAQVWGRQQGERRATTQPDDPAREDAKRLQGVWVATRIEQVDHRPTEAEEAFWKTGQFTITIRDNRITFDIDKSFTYFSLSPSQRPKVITLEVPDGPDKGRHVPAIYRLDGDDLMICQGRLEDTQPPAGFSLRDRRPGTFPTLFVLRRKPSLSESFRARVDEVAKDPGVIVTRIEVESLPGASVEVVADKPGRGGVLVVAPGEPDEPAHTQLTILADHVEWKAGPTDLLKFMMSIKGGAAFSTMSDIGPMPEAKRLADVLTVALTPGEYEYGVATKLATYKDVTYNLVVKKPR